MAKRKRKAGYGVPFTLGDIPTNLAHALLTVPRNACAIQPMR
ncbi:hypothetical protein FHS63_000966 [Azospirillum doebereinerae]